MPEHDGHGLIVIGVPSDPNGRVIIQQGNNTDIEYTRRQARSLVSGPSPRCCKAWIVQTIFDVTADTIEPKAP